MGSFILGTSNSFRQTLRAIDRYATTHWPLLLLGETGVGKECFAKRAHELSPRRTAPFIAINCGALPPALFESELFGYERGAFSGAVTTHAGLAKAANGGTLFLDEIGELELPLQTKLLRLLENSEIRRVGSVKCEKVDIRIIAATNKDLNLEVAEGRFRRDLFERLGVLTVEVPALRHRLDDIPLLATQLLAELGVPNEIENWDFALSFPWPGNVRQLKNLLIRGSVLGGGKLTELGFRKLLSEETMRLSRRPQNSDAISLAEIEKQAIVERLQKHQGNRKLVAKELGIAKSTLQEKIKKFKQSDAIVSFPRLRLTCEPALS